MIGGVSWADVAIFAVLAFAISRGFARGLIRELAGIVALAAALIVPWYYNGSLDATIAHYGRLDLPVSHVIGMGIASVCAYVVVLASASLLSRVKNDAAGSP